MLVSLKNVGPEMENIGQKKKPCEKKKTFAKKNGFGKCF